ncbi:type II toxin-antitoxin system Phd/YefM family antitoxin [Desulfitibacter alkalitolerans]|uniref:type II toxin-antitoxin system Phd/YefM family antitoxin n=1 Tax=Desulfitibacter alkalitolerans TaxID=264641 RepID=UPI0004861145|nr:type II toxin-antitoxin system Phd/YefM family antitoxin [Desulfitibacter alkalitolerans]
MFTQDKFISTSELQQNVSKTIDKVKNQDVIIIRNNKLEAAIISIEKYNQFLDYLQWKNISDALDKLPTENISNKEADKAIALLRHAQKEQKFTADEIEKIAESGIDYNEL